MLPLMQARLLMSIALLMLLVHRLIVSMYISMRTAMEYMITALTATVAGLLAALGFLGILWLALLGAMLAAQAINGWFAMFIILLLKLMIGLTN
jgi:hypothetical protein